MNISEYFSKYSSDSVAGSSNQILYQFEREQTFTGRLAYKLTNGGKNYSLLFSNIIDSTYHNGQYSKCNDVGQPWTVHLLKVGISNAWNDYPKDMKTVTFEGKEERFVSGNDIFCTDPIELNADKDQYLHIEMTFTGTIIPCHREINLNVQKQNENGIFVEDNTMPVPLMIGVDNKVEKKIAFIGDSITQGIGTPMESYKHWVAQVTQKLNPNVSVWDLGIGFAKAFDASSDGFWLERAKQCDTVNICFGVNDLFFDRSYEQIINDLEKINSLLKQARCKTIIFTIPPFDFADESLEKWQKANEYIRTTLSLKADGFFDFAKYTCEEKPNDNIAKYGGHPNEEGCTVIAQAYLNDISI